MINKIFYTFFMLSVITGQESPALPEGSDSEEKPSSSRKESPAKREYTDDDIEALVRKAIIEGKNI